MKILTVVIAAIAALQPPSVDQVLARMDQYMVSYEPKLSELIADEKMVQSVRGFRPLSAGDVTVYETVRNRRIESEVAFVALPSDAGWLGFRHVTSVDKRPVKLSRQSLTAALTEGSHDRAVALLKESAQHNLGLPRTTNLPNLPLEFLHRRNRTRFAARLDGSERVRDTNSVRVVLIERSTPTLIQNSTGADMPSVVRAWLDPDKGDLLRAEVSTYVNAGDRTPVNRLVVDFTRHKALDMLVPSQMWEKFPVERSGEGSSSADYSKFRRFTTSARIVPPSELQ